MNRIKWVDIFKGIVIVLMVLGHATGMFNMFIYQFHMGAFFFISGYTTDLNKRSFVGTFVYKACTLLLPLITSFTMFYVLYRVLFYSYPNINFNSPYDVSVWDHSFLWFLKELLVYGRDWINVMGATWFLSVLFFTAIIGEILYKCLRKSILVLIVSVCVSCSLYMLQFYHLWQAMDLALIALPFYIAGIVTKEYDMPDWFSKLLPVWKWGCGIVSIALLFVFAYRFPALMDWPSRSFSSFPLNMIAVLNGSFFVYLLSQVFQRNPILEKTFSFLGKNTLAIVILHFFAFKVSFLLLGISVGNFLPPKETTVWELLFIVSVSIGLSLGLWRLVLCVPFMRILFGQEKSKYELWYKKIGIECVFPNSEEFMRIDITRLEKIWNIKWKTACTFLQKNRFECLAFVIFLTLIGGMLMHQGITLNDELQFRLHRMYGLKHLVVNRWMGELYQGRPLRILAAFNESMGFLFTSYLWSRLFQLFFLGLNLVPLGMLLYKIFANKYIGLLAGVLWLAYLPITFEHAVPNAFVTLCSIPVTFLLLSLNSFCSFLHTKKNLYYIICMILLTISLCGYEYMVTFVLLFPILAKYMLKIRWITSLKMSTGPLLISIVYIVLLFSLQKVFPPQYGGLQIDWMNWKACLAVIKQLFESSLPGYFLGHCKYLYSIFVIHIAPLGLIHIGRWHFGYLDVLFLFAFFVILRSIFLSISYANIRNISWKMNMNVLAVLGAYMIIPLLPNSITRMYHEAHFVSLPVNYCTSLVFAVLLSYILYSLIRMFGYNWLMKLVILFLLIVGTFIFNMNMVFSTEQHMNFARLTTMEKMVQTRVFYYAMNHDVYSTDLFRTKCLLAIHDGYWDGFAKANGWNIHFKKEMPDIRDRFAIYENQGTFTFIKGNDGIVFSPEVLTQEIPIRIGENKSVIFPLMQPIHENQLYLYPFRLSIQGNEMKVEVFKTADYFSHIFQ